MKNQNAQNLYDSIETKVQSLHLFMVEAMNIQGIRDLQRSIQKKITTFWNLKFSEEDNEVLRELIDENPEIYDEILD